MTSASHCDFTLETLRQIAPSAFTEVRGDNGTLRHKVDFDTLRELLQNNNILEVDEERFGFYWVGKQAAKRAAAEPTHKTLRPVMEDSVDWDTTANLYIEGDNLEVLKLLQRAYLGKVKMIYIDPPYNTGKDFIYQDQFDISRAEEDELMRNLDEEGNRLRSNPKSHQRYHSDWCSMIYSRLMLARTLLSRDGVIFISIDDNEVHHLRCICDEVFGPNNFIGELIVKTATDNNPSQICKEHEYMLCYAREIETQTKWECKSEAASKIIKQYNKPKNREKDPMKVQEKLRKWIKNHKDELPHITHYNCVDEKGVYSCSGNSSNPHPGGYMYDIIHPITKGICPKPLNGWRWPLSTFLDYKNQGEVEWGKDHTTQPHIKKRIETVTDFYVHTFMLIIEFLHGF